MTIWKVKYGYSRKELDSETRDRLKESQRAYGGYQDLSDDAVRVAKSSVSMEGEKIVSTIDPLGCDIFRATALDAIGTDDVKELCEKWNFHLKSVERLGECRTPPGYTLTEDDDESQPSEPMESAAVGSDT